jgi:hypothetical protein
MKIIEFGAYKIHKFKGEILKPNIIFIHINIGRKYAIGFGLFYPFRIWHRLWVGGYSIKIIFFWMWICLPIKKIKCKYR